MVNIDKLERLAGKAVNKMLGGKLAKMPLEEQVRFAKTLMAMPGGGLETTRAKLLSDGGIPEDIRDMLKAGKSRTEIKDYYWGCEAFREFWVDILQMMEGMLDTLIDDTCVSYSQR